LLHHHSVRWRHALCNFQLVPAPVQCLH
jgi:hypothetical protein